MGILICLFAKRLQIKRRAAYIVNRFQKAQNHDAGSHTCSKKHGDPGEIGVLRLILSAAQLHVPVLTDCQPDQKTKGYKTGQQVQKPQPSCTELKYT